MLIERNLIYNNSFEAKNSRNGKAAKNELTPSFKGVKNLKIRNDLNILKDLRKEISLNKKYKDLLALMPND